MERQLNQHTTHQYRRKYNGRRVMSALRSLGGKATASELTRHIAILINQPEGFIKSEVKQMLGIAVTNGFLLRQGKNYCLLNALHMWQYDCYFDRKESLFSSTDEKEQEGKCGSGKHRSLSFKIPTWWKRFWKRFFTQPLPETSTTIIEGTICASPLQSSGTDEAEQHQVETLESVPLAKADDCDECVPAKDDNCDECISLDSSVDVDIYKEISERMTQ